MNVATEFFAQVDQDPEPHAPIQGVLVGVALGSMVWAAVFVAFVAWLR